MNEEEKEIMELLVEAHRKFIATEQTHPSDIDVWVNGIHSCQGILMQRVARRDYPEQFYTTPQNK